MIWFSYLACACVVLFVMYLFYHMSIIEPNRVEVTTLALKTDKKLNAPLKVVQISDVHLKTLSTLKNFEKIIAKINHMRADIVFITGDFLDNAHTYPLYNETAHILKTMNARLGVYAIVGNHEAKYKEVKKTYAMYQDAGIHCLVNQGKCIDTDDMHLHIYGADCAMYGKSQNDFISTRKSDAYTILLLHQPDAILDYQDYPIDLVLSGHTHNGQINFWGFAPIRPTLGKKYLAGLFENKIGENTLYHYVNRGLGTTHFPFRLNSIPEITEINIAYEK